jgi:Na+/H+ antiporter
MPNELAKIKIKKAIAEASLKFQSEKFCNEENFLFQKLKEVWNFELESEILRSATRQGRGFLKF